MRRRVFTFLRARNAETLARVDKKRRYSQIDLSLLRESGKLIGRAERRFSPRGASVFASCCAGALHDPTCAPRDSIGKLPTWYDARRSARARARSKRRALPHARGEDVALVRRSGIISGMIK